MTNNRLTSAQRYGRQQESLLAALPFILCTNKLRFVITAYGQLHQKRTSFIKSVRAATARWLLDSYTPMLRKA